MNEAGKIEDDIKLPTVLSINIAARAGISYSEVGLDNDAQRILSKLKESLLVSKDKQKKAVICLWGYDIANRLNNTSMSQMYLDWLGDYLNSMEPSAVKNALNDTFARVKEIKELTDEGDYKKILLFYQELAGGAEQSSMRDIVEWKFQESLCYRALNNVVAERDCLNFIIEKGNRLKIVNESKKRLEELNSC